MKCAVNKCINCNSKKNQYIGFYRFPKEETACKEWVIFCQQNVDTAKARICGEHFRPEDFERRLQVEMGFGKAMRLKPGAVPTIFNKRDKPENSERCKRISKRKNEIVSALPQESPVMEEVQQHEDVLEEIQIEIVDLSNQLLHEKIKLLESQVEDLKRKNFSLQQAAIEMEKKNHALQQRTNKAEFERKIIEEKLLCIFTPGQIKKFKSGNKRRNWCEEDISRSITFYSASAKVYKLLRKNNFPLPSERTLQHWAQKNKNSHRKL